MRFLLIHCSELRLRDINRSDRPSEILEVETEKMSDEQVYHDILGVFICVESADKVEYIEDAVSEIKRHKPMAGLSNTVVVIPFAHLSSHIAPPSKAIYIIESLIKELRNERFSVYGASFGYHKDFALSWLVPGHSGCVAFRRIPNKIDTDVENLLKSYGKDKLLDTINKIEKKKGKKE